ncbi:heavy-metal-associated domain-containing protein [Dietzia sp.]|uniref:heavy-metal-associated domain-containing protein n=1 Tax=Dietzia sp. TaxID=1871616 RepID=UPI002FD8BF6D
MATTTIITVTGMTCGHCTSTVGNAIDALDGVEDVAVDLDSGAVTIRSDGELNRDAVSKAVADAGYAVAPEGEPGLGDNLLI